MTLKHKISPDREVKKKINLPHPPTELSNSESVSVLSVHYAAAAQPATLRLRLRPNRPPGLGDDAQHGQTHPAVSAVHRLLQEHLHAPRQPGVLHAGLQSGRAADEGPVSGDGAQRHLQVRN